MGRDWDAERVALMALALVPVVFGLQSAIDWTWFVPGPAVMALVAAGFVAGRGPSGAPLLPSDRLPRPDPSRIVPAVAVVVAALAFVWAIWQPEASERKIDVAVAQSDRGNEAGAAASAQEAAEANPLSSQPLLLKAAVEARGNRLPASQTDLQRAVLKFPNEPQTWLQLASFQLRDQVRPDAALETVKGALYLDPRSRLARQLFLDARAVLRAQQLRAGRR
jgi:tetratricopeptide (TPR) repeat protein